MKTTSVWPWFLLGTLILVPLPPARGQEVIHLRTGQVGGAPGLCGQPDDRFRYDPGFAPNSCAQPLRNAPFTAADFAAAAAGPTAVVVDPFNPWWLPALPADPLARWIDWQRTGTCNGDVGSILYACRFTVATPCATAGDISVCWAVDDILGDPVGAGPNPIGVYLNGVALAPAFSGGGLGGQACASQSNVPLIAGDNVLYVYQRDQFCTASGLILGADITVTNARPSAGGAASQLTTGEGGEYAPSWSPDGTVIAYVHFDAGQNKGQIRGIAPTGGPSFLLVDDTGVWAVKPAWSPDGQRLAYEKGSPHNIWIASVNAHE